MAIKLRERLISVSRLNLGPKARPFFKRGPPHRHQYRATWLEQDTESLTRDFDTRAERDNDLNLRTMSLAFAEAFPDAKVIIQDGIVSRIEIPQMPEFVDHRIVDRATSYVGGNATLFVYDEASQQFVRKSTRC